MIAPVRALEDAEDVLLVLRRYADTVVADRENPIFAISNGRDLNSRFLST